MALDLPRIVARLSRRRSPIRFNVIRPSANQERNLFLIYNQVPREWAKVSRERIVPAYSATLEAYRPKDSLQRDDVPGLGGEINASEESVSRLIVKLTTDIQSWIVAAEAIHRKAFIASAKTAAGVNLSTILTVDGVQTTVDAILQANLGLIRNVSDDLRKRIADAVFRGFQIRQPMRDLAAIINEATDLGRRRSLLIASDQTTKMASALDRERQQEIGIDQFIWRHSGKVHYRPEHKARDGQIFRWDDEGIADDLPGYAINCGCKAQAYVESPVNF